MAVDAARFVERGPCRRCNARAALAQAAVVVAVLTGALLTAAHRTARHTTVLLARRRPVADWSTPFRRDGGRREPPTPHRTRRPRSSFMDWAAACIWIGRSAHSSTVQTMGPIHSASTSGLYSWQGPVARALGGPCYPARAPRSRSTRRTATTSHHRLVAHGARAGLLRPDERPPSRPPPSSTPCHRRSATGSVGAARVVRCVAAAHRPGRRDPVPGAPPIRRGSRRRSICPNLAGERSIEAVPHFHVFVVNTSVAQAATTRARRRRASPPDEER